jgi:hypothetical protein
MNVDLSTKDEQRLASGDQLNIALLTDEDLHSGAFPEHCKSSPPLTVMSYSMKTVMNYKKNVNEIVAFSAVVYHQGTLMDFRLRITFIITINICT